MAAPRQPACRQAGIVAYEIKDVQSKGAMVDKPSVADDVLQVAHQTELEEDHGVYTFLTAFTVISFGKSVKVTQVQHLL